jgi:THO complex subunit 3
MIPLSESRFIQQCVLKLAPSYTQYAPDGRSLLYVTAGQQLMFLSYGKEPEDTKEQWQPKILPNQKESVCSYDTESPPVVPQLFH